MDTAQLRRLKEINKLVTLPPVRQTEFLSFYKARTMVRAQHFNNKTEFEAWKKPVGMPSNPNLTYIDSGWLGYGDFLGNAFMSFTKARTLARAQHFNNQKEFYAWKKPVGMPSSPRGVYKTSGWTNWGDFLGTGNTHGGQRRTQ